MSLLTKSNINDHCRTCLKQLNESIESSISEFNPDDVQDTKDLHFNICNDPELQHLISINIDDPCTSEDMNAIAHNFPENICLACYNNIYSFAVFRRKALRSAEKLRTVLYGNDNIKIEINLEHCENEPIKDDCQLHDATVEKVEIFFETTVTNLVDAELNEDTMDTFSPPAPSISDCSENEVEEKVKEKPAIANTKCSNSTKKITKPNSSKHKTKDKYKCPTCNINFTRDCDLTDHLTNEHAHGTTPFLCDYCTSSYRRLRNLKDHIVQRHQDKIKEGKHFQCTECPKVYLDELAVRRHIRLHFLDKKTCVCKICNEGFPAKKWLVDHLRTHTADGRLPCIQCDKTYLHYEDLENHERAAHLKEKPYHCEICDKSFQTKQTYRIHSYQHTGNTRFMCDICGKGFYQGTPLKKHKKSHFKTKLKKQKLA